MAHINNAQAILLEQLTSYRQQEFNIEIADAKKDLVENYQELRKSVSIEIQMQNLSFQEEQQCKFFIDYEINEYQLKWSTEILKNLVALRKKMSSEQYIPSKEFIAQGLLQDLKQIFQESIVPLNSETKFEILWIYTNVCSDTTEEVKQFLELNLIGMMSDYSIKYTDDYKYLEQFSWLLGNIAGDSVKHRNILIENYFILDFVGQKLSELTETQQQMNQENQQFQENYSQVTKCLKELRWCISNLGRGKQQPKTEYAIQIIEICQEQLDQLMKNEQGGIIIEEYYIDLIWCFSYLSDTSDLKIVDAMIDKQSVASLLQIFCNFSHSVKILSPVIRTLGNFISQDDPKYTNTIISQAQFLNKVNELIIQNDTKDTIKKELAWTISNAVSNDIYQAIKIIQGNTINSILYMVENQPNLPVTVKNEVAYVFSNLINILHADIVLHFSQEIVLKIYYFFEQSIQANQNQKKFLEICLEGLELLINQNDQIVWKYGQDFNLIQKIQNNNQLIDVLENLQSHESEAVYQKSLSIMEKADLIGNEDIEGGEEEMELE